MKDSEKHRQFKKERRVQLKSALKIRKDTYAEIVRLLTQAEKDTKALLTDYPTEYQAYYLPQLQTQIKEILSQVAKQSGKTIEQGANSSWQSGVDLIDRPLIAGGVQISGMLPIISTKQLVAMRSFMVDRIENVSFHLANKVSSQLGLAMIGSQTIGESVTNIQRLFKNQGRTRALTIVRTELGRAYSVATHERMLQASKILPGLKKQWRRSGKVHSRLSHDDIDGQIREPHKKFQLGNGVELRFPRDPKAPAAETINCGCEELPIMEDWEVQHPDRKPFSELEKQLNPRKGNYEG